MWLIKAETSYKSRLVIICSNLLAALGFGCGPDESLASCVADFRVEIRFYII